MRRYMLKRLLQLIPVLLGITFFSFTFMQMASGDVVEIMCENSGVTVSQQVMNARKAELGLDRPFMEQYLSWLVGMMTGDMGTSFVSGQKVFETLIVKLPNTIKLTLSSVILTVIISIPLGILSAVKKNHFIDYAIRFCSFLGNSMPNFFISLVLLLIFSVKLDWLPVIGGGDDLKSLILPTLTLTIAMSAKYTRQVRATVLEELGKDYVIGARARGVREQIIIYKSVLRVSMLTIVTLLSLSIGSLLGGTAIVETIFMWDGVGKMAVDAVAMRDYPMIQAYVVWMAIIYVVVNLMTDFIYHYLDPRVRIEQGD